MPTPDNTRVGAPCWIDLFTSDPERAKEFYGSLFGWTAASAGEEYGGYINFSKDGRRVAGCMRNDGSAGTPDAWSVYLMVENAKETADAVTRHGGQVYLPPMDVLQLGVMSVVADPGGAAIGMWQQGDHRGFEIIAEAGAPGWFELHTRDYDETVAFYRDVFRWETHAASDVPEFRYTTLFGGEASAAGIMDASAFLPEGVPAHWSIYFAVENTDAALEKIASLGGAVVMPAEDTPFGRLATATDPTGTMFKLVG
jgi:predicted enzyme related to lactoylglutathione lyase